MAMAFDCSRSTIRRKVQHAGTFHDAQRLQVYDRTWCRPNHRIICAMATIEIRCVSSSALANVGLRIDSSTPCLTGKSCFRRDLEAL